jgi:hypothetical protein
MNTLTYVKLGLVGLVIVLIGAFVLAGKLDATLAIGAITTVVHETTAAVKAASVHPPKV